MSSSNELQYLGDARDLNYYKDQATNVDFPDVGQESPEAVRSTDEPRRIRHPRKDQVQDLTLEDALRTSLMNAEIIRDNAQFLSAGNRLLSNPDFTSSIHDVAIQETNTLFGQGGVEAALSEFDATFTTNMTWGRSESVSDSASIGLQAFDGINDEFGDFRSEISKIFGNGGQFTAEHNWLYTETSQGRAGARPFNAEFTNRATANADGGIPTVGFEYRQPLLLGAGTEYTRIAGPAARRPTLQSTPTVNQGVVIARIRTDITISEFESSVAQLLRDVEDTYWDLYLTYRTYDAETIATSSALQTWREVRANLEVGKVGAADEAQARDNYFESRARRESSLANLYQQELRLRRLMGLPVNDGGILRPTQDPVTAQLIANWNVSMAEALTNRPELRRQKWNIKSLELQHKAALMLIRPRLDMVARYQVNGFGQRLTGEGSNFRSAYDTLLGGDYTGWGMGFEFSMPLGFRGATAQANNIEHRLSKARATLAQQEQEISYELASSFQQIDQAYQTAQTNFNRRRAAERRLSAFESEYEVGRTSLDLVLRAQISLSQAEIAYYSSVVSYNRALNDLRYRKGTILADNSIYLSESLWTECAYEDALRRAWQRSFAFEAPNKETLPSEFALGDAATMAPTEWMDHPEPLPVEEGLPPMEPPASVPAPTDVPPPPPGDRSALRPNAETGGLQKFQAQPLDRVPQPSLPYEDLVEPANGVPGEQSSIQFAPPNLPGIDADSSEFGVTGAGFQADAAKLPEFEAPMIQPSSFVAPPPAADRAKPAADKAASAVPAGLHSGLSADSSSTKPAAPASHTTSKPAIPVSGAPKADPNFDALLPQVGVFAPVTDEAPAQASSIRSALPSADAFDRAAKQVIDPVIEAAPADLTNIPEFSLPPTPPVRDDFIAPANRAAGTAIDTIDAAADSAASQLEEAARVVPTIQDRAANAIPQQQLQFAPPKLDPPRFEQPQFEQPEFTQPEFTQPQAGLSNFGQPAVRQMPTAQGQPSQVPVQSRRELMSPARMVAGGQSGAPLASPIPTTVDQNSAQSRVVQTGASLPVDGQRNAASPGSSGGPATASSTSGGSVGQRGPVSPRYDDTDSVQPRPRYSWMKALKGE